MNNFLKEGLTGLWKDILHVNRARSFEEIIGHNDIKQIFVKAIRSKRPVHLLLIGPPGSAKTMFLTEIIRHYKGAYFVVGSNTTKAGLLNQLFETRPRLLLIDELEKMNLADQTALLHLMETGIISETKMRKTREMELTSWVFATGNSCDNLIEPLLSRFVILEVPEYSFEEFIDIAISRLAKEKINRDIATIMAEKVWTVLNSRDIRDVIKVARLVTNQEDISRIIGVMKRYSKQDNNQILDFK